MRRLINVDPRLINVATRQSKVLAGHGNKAIGGKIPDDLCKKLRIYLEFPSITFLSS